MRILISNDDGIHAPGLVVLENIARALTDDVVVVAPETDQSGVSHSLSLSHPLRLRTIVDGRRYAVTGTPSDCVIMAVQHILKDKAPDLVLSGVNRGQNIAEDVTYSGTIAAAMEGTLLNIPSIALSQAHGSDDGDVVPWNCAEQHAPAIIRKLLAHGFGKNMLFNLNFPDCQPGEVRGISTTVQGHRDQAALLDVVERTDFRSNPYYWLAFRKARANVVEGTDLWAIAEKRIAITPIKLDLTDVAALERLSTVFDSVR